jgi:hypothetical protein
MCFAFSAKSVQSITGPTVTRLPDTYLMRGELGPAGSGYAIMHVNFSLSENRLKNRFNFVFSNGVFL